MLSFAATIEKGIAEKLKIKEDKRTTINRRDSTRNIQERLQAF
ncbi:hypothetical protein RCH18_002047 [Flavobacterium sp. PL11]|jgi:hypothetical protein|nr:hypothetical protein [Flavobacterium sp. PL11]